jgi:hypothetical protein
MQDNKSDHQAEHDQIDIINTQDMIVTQKYQT